MSDGNQACFARALVSRPDPLWLKNVREGKERRQVVILGDIRQNDVLKRGVLLIGMVVHTVRMPKHLRTQPPFDAIHVNCSEIIGLLRAKEGLDNLKFARDLAQWQTRNRAQGMWAPSGSYAQV